MTDKGFTLKEVMLAGFKEQREDLASFRREYREDKIARDDQISRRPTRKELYSVMGVFLTGMGVLMALLGG